LANEPLAPGFSIDELAQLTSGYSGSDLQELCKKVRLATRSTTVMMTKATVMMVMMVSHASPAPRVRQAAVAPLRHFLEEEERRQTATATTTTTGSDTHGLRPMHMQDFIEAMKEVLNTPPSCVSCVRARVSCRVACLC
jgi:SpoVK/Ycf46/Vps4 family AAA+-type ATPase